MYGVFPCVGRREYTETNGEYNNISRSINGVIRSEWERVVTTRNEIVCHTQDLRVHWSTVVVVTIIIIVFVAQ